MAAAAEREAAERQRQQRWRLSPAAKLPPTAKPAAAMPPLPPYYHRCHCRHASLTLPSCHGHRKAVAATATAATATTAVALLRRRHLHRRRAPDAAQLLLPSCCRRHHHRAEPAPQCFRRRCQAAVTATAATSSPRGAVECEAPFMNKEGNKVGVKKVPSTELYIRVNVTYRLLGCPAGL